MKDLFALIIILVCIGFLFICGIVNLDKVIHNRIDFYVKSECLKETKDAN